MPKQTFYNLKEEKKQRLLDAAKEEFSRVSLYDASISNILKTAGIPRGSFYQYFEGKEDAFFYLLKEQAKERHEKFVTYLKKYNGDLFDTMNEVFRIQLEQSQNKDKNDLIRNVILNINYKIENIFTEITNDETFRERYEEICQLVDTSKLNITGNEELFNVLQIIKAVTIQNLMYGFEKELSTGEALKKYSTEMDLLKKGLNK